MSVLNASTRQRSPASSSPAGFLFSDRPAAEGAANAQHIPQTAPAPAIQVDRLSVTLRGVPALRDLSLHITPGEFVLVSGPSGSGKSTLARALAGLLHRQAGTAISGMVQVGALDVFSASAAQVAPHLGIVFQNPHAQLFNLTVADELACGPANLGLPPDAIGERAAWVADILGLTPLLQRRLDTLSGGEVQRVAIGAVLAMGARVLILDEPTSSLDVQGMRQVITALKRLNQELGTTILLIEHRLGEMAHLASRVVLLEDGQLVADGPCADVFQDHALLRRLGMRRPSPEPASDWPDLVGANGTPAPAPGQSPLLALEAVEVRYGRQTVLHDINLTLWPGEFAALVGENGAGKSTLAMVAAGLMRPRQGQRTFNGQKRANLGRDVGLLFQNPLDQLFCDTVDEEIAFGPHNFGCYSPQQHQQTVEECALTAVLHRPVYALSAGQQQRVALAASLALRPALLILDEPTLGQDWGHLEQLMRFLVQLNAQGTAILMITHDYKLVHRYAGRVIVMHKGRIVADGQPINRQTKED